MRILYVTLALMISYCVRDVHAADDSDEPGLMTMLNTIKGHPDVSSLLKYVDEYKMARDLFREVSAVFPLMNRILNTAAKKNAKLEVLLKIVKGEMPNLQDLYRLATTKSGNILTDIQLLKYTVPGWSKFQKLIHTKNILSTQKGVEQLTQVFTGQTVHVKKSLVQRMASTDFKPAPGDDIAVMNVIEFLMFVMENMDALTDIGNSIVGLNSSSQVLSMVLKLDFSHLQKVVKQTDLMHDGKYQVGLRDMKPDSEVLQLNKDISSGQSLNLDDSKSNDQAQDLVMDITKRVFGLASLLLGRVEAEGTSAPNTFR